jgi:hypothetical protein
VTRNRRLMAFLVFFLDVSCLHHHTLAHQFPSFRVIFERFTLSYLIMRSTASLLAALALRFAALTTAQNSCAVCDDVHFFLARGNNVRASRQSFECLRSLNTAPGTLPRPTRRTRGSNLR